jgi:predicted unusual protein kinase regulating ubiquinone biosynthesis (AarF/ABC1/UbiB family)
MARVGARSGFSILRGGDGSAAAEQAMELLGNLRGLAAKVGQLASYVDGFVPEPQREAYERVLSRLQTATPASPFAQVRETVEAELGRTLEQAFAEFDSKPMASASIGQVHRALLHGGPEVAVKVQHPGIEAAFEADLTSAGSMAGLVSMLGPKAMNPAAIFEEVAARLREELDYTLEARHQREFASLHAVHPLVHVPAVIDTHSSRRVLTSELVRGLDFTAAARAPEALRRGYAELLWHFVFKSLLIHGMFNADPHPGNYLFHEDGRITFLDFGCVQRMEPEQRRCALQMHRAAMRQDEALFMQAARQICQTQPGPYETDLLAYLYRCYDPLKRSPFRMEREYVAAVVRGIQDLKGHLLKKGSNVTPVPNGLVLTNRLQFGFYSVLARLDVEADYAGVERAFMGAAEPA